MIWPISVSGVLNSPGSSKKKRCSEDSLWLNYHIVKIKSRVEIWQKYSYKHKTNQIDPSRLDSCTIESLNTTQITIWPTRVHQTAKISSSLNVGTTKGYDFLCMYQEENNPSRQATTYVINLHENQSRVWD